jgi:hypothetical protein
MAAVATVITATPVEMAQPVSPGGARAFPTIDGRCPTFSWTAVDGARGYELVAYLVSEKEALLSASPDASAAVMDQMRPALRVQLPAKASSWTPSGAQCLAGGESYAWAVRALTESSELAWSDAYLFEVGSAPGEEEVREALETLERYLEKGGNTAVLPVVMAAPTTSALSAPAPLLPGTIPTITSWAINAELADTGSATAGLEARSNSATGIGVIAQNTATDGQIASFQNASQEVAKIAGDGTVEATAFVGDGSGLTNLPGGGGGSPIALFTSNTSPPSTGGAVATLNVSAPAGGCTLLTTGTVDLNYAFDGTFDEPNCEIQVDSTALTGSNMGVYVDAFVYRGQCVSSGGITLTEGMHTISFVVSVDTVGEIDAAIPDSATLWALCAP